MENSIFISAVLNNFYLHSSTMKFPSFGYFNFQISGNTITVPWGLYVFVAIEGERPIESNYYAYDLRSAVCLHYAPMLILFPSLTHMRALHMEDMAWWEMSTNNNPIQKEELHSGTYCHKHYQMLNFKNAYNMDIEWQTNYRSCKNMDILEFLAHLTSLLLKCMDPKLNKMEMNSPMLIFFI